jgi:hypothetical protein
VVFELDFLLTNRADFLKAQSLFAPYKITIGEGAILKQIHNPKNIEEQIVELSKLLKENNFRSANKEGVA